MSSILSLLHSVPGSESDLQTFARYWHWERHVRQTLPEVLSGKTIYTVYQPIFNLKDGRAQASGFEAFARFDGALHIPVGLWFRISRESGLDTPLERLAATTAVESSDSLPPGHFLNINASLKNAGVVARDIAMTPRRSAVIDLPCRSLSDGSCRAVFDELREQGMEISLDDTPLEQLHEMRPSIEEIRPRYLKVDVLIGLFDNMMGRFNLSEAAAWCQDLGIVLVAERVEQPRDLELLYGLGVEMAQGYSLAHPA